ncbi:MAG TPA: hypothetical protein DEB09_05900 [Candidatus Magasanikbacteria bacterium]|nr:hypothetical protein [Candidatus Magasanikbacteria bacterium]
MSAGFGGGVEQVGGADVAVVAVRDGEAHVGRVLAVGPGDEAVGVGVAARGRCGDAHVVEAVLVRGAVGLEPTATVTGVHEGVALHAVTGHETELLDLPFALRRVRSGPAVRRHVIAGEVPVAVGIGVDDLNGRVVAHAPHQGDGHRECHDIARGGLAHPVTVLQDDLRVFELVSGDTFPPTFSQIAPAQGQELTPRPIGLET